MMTNADPVSSSTSTVGPPPPFDAELAAALRVINETTKPDGLRPETIGATRQKAAAFMPPPSDEELARDGAFVVGEWAVPGPAGAPAISLLICRPTSATTPTPAIYHIHGGGMVVGDCRTGVQGMLDLAEKFGLAVVSVEYRLAPETPHPGPVEDCYAGLVWCAAHAREHGIDPERIVLIGASAGGGLAAAVALLARDRGGPAVLGQMLLCPMLDDRNDTPSAVQLAGLGIWDRTSNETGWAALLGDARGTDEVSPYAAPARATDLSGLPPAFIDVGSAETFRDEDVTYASRIWQAGGSAELHVWPGGFHGFAGLAPRAAISQDAQGAPLRWLRRLLST
jgi:acetyl esterase/lipase